MAIGGALQHARLDDYGGRAYVPVWQSRERAHSHARGGIMDLREAGERAAVDEGS